MLDMSEMPADMDSLVREFKAVSEARACIVLHGMGRPFTEQDFIMAGIVCATRNPHLGPADEADWRLFRMEVGNNDYTPSPHITLPSWMVDGVQAFVTEDELDTIIGETPCRNWVVGVTAFAESIPSQFRNERTIEVLRMLEDAAKTLPPERETQINESLKLKVDLVRKARLNPEPDDEEITVAIVGL